MTLFICINPTPLSCVSPQVSTIYLHLPPLLASSQPLTTTNLSHLLHIAWQNIQILHPFVYFTNYTARTKHATLWVCAEEE